MTKENNQLSNNDEFSLDLDTGLPDDSSLNLNAESPNSYSVLPEMNFEAPHKIEGVSVTENTMNVDDVATKDINAQEAVGSLKAEPNDRTSTNQKNNGNKANKPLFKRKKIAVIVGAVIVGWVGLFFGLKSLTSSNEPQQNGAESAMMGQQVPDIQNQGGADSNQANQLMNNNTQNPMDSQMATNVNQMGGVVRGEDNYSVGQVVNNGSLSFDVGDNQSETQVTHELSAEEILRSKKVEDMTQEELTMAYQLLDRQLYNDQQSQSVIISRMKELNYSVPISQIETERALRDKQIVEEVTRSITSKFANQLQSLSNRIDDQNKEMVRLADSISNALSKVMTEIKVDDIRIKKQKAQEEALTEANAELFKQYKIHQIIGGRVWISKNNEKAKSYIVGDSIDDGLTLESIDLDKQGVVTNKGSFYIK